MSVTPGKSASVSSERGHLTRHVPSANLAMTHVLRVPQIDLTSLLTEQNPQIDLRLQSYETSTRNFLKALLIYKNHAISVITERRNNQNAERKRITAKIQSVETEINLCKVKEIELLAGRIIHILAICQN